MTIWEFTIRRSEDDSDDVEYVTEFAVADTLSEAVDLVTLFMDDDELIDSVENLSGDRPVWTPEIV